MNVYKDKLRRMLTITITQADEAWFYVDLLDDYLRTQDELDHGAYGDRQALLAGIRQVWPKTMPEDPVVGEEA